MIRNRVAALAFSLLLLPATLLESGSPPATVEREVDRLLAPLVEGDLASGAVLIAKRGKIVLAKGYGSANREHGVPNTPETVYGIASISKSITAIAILQLVERGQLRLDDTLARFVPDFPRAKSITVEQLLTHTSGVRSYVFLPGFREKQRLELRIDEIVRWIAESELEFEPGDRFQYSNSGFMLLTHIIQQVSGVSYDDYLREHIFAPARMSDSGMAPYTRVTPRRATGHSRDGCTGEMRRASFREPTFDQGAGSLYSTVLDFDRLDRALRQGKLLTMASQTMMYKPRVESSWGDAYGYGWFIGESHGRRLVHHEGGTSGFMTSFRRFVDDEVLVVALFNQDLIIADELFSRLDAIALGEPWEPLFATEAAEEDFQSLAEFTGTYRMDPEGTLRVEQEGGPLFLEEPGCSRFGIWPMSSNRGFATGPNALLEFSENQESGRTQVRAQYGALRWVGERIPASNGLRVRSNDRRK